MQTQYVTERRTIVTASRIGRPRKQPGAPKSPYKPRRPINEPDKPNPKGKIEILGGNGKMVLIDGCVPRAFAEAIKTLFDSLP